MRRWLAGAVGCGVLAAMAGAAAERFSQAVSAADFAAAGLAKLSPEELARLDALVSDFRSGAREHAHRGAVAAGTRATPAAARVNEARAESGPPAKAKVVLAPGTQVEFGAVESRLAGEFAGWSARTVFVLENGQRWQVSGGDSYVTPPVPGPAVKITPGALGSFWMTIEGVRPRVRVVRVDAAR